MRLTSNPGREAVKLASNPGRERVKLTSNPGRDSVEEVLVRADVRHNIGSE